jgi:hypothetical protein
MLQLQNYTDNKREEKNTPARKVWPKEGYNIIPTFSQTGACFLFH